jgi:hypothetical protein
VCGVSPQLQGTRIGTADIGELRTLVCDWLPLGQQIWIDVLWFETSPPHGADVRRPNSVPLSTVLYDVILEH